MPESESLKPLNLQSDGLRFICLNWHERNKFNDQKPGIRVWSKATFRPTESERSDIPATELFYIALDIYNKRDKKVSEAKSDKADDFDFIIWIAFYLLELANKEQT